MRKLEAWFLGESELIQLPRLACPFFICRQRKVGKFESSQPYACMSRSRWGVELAATAVNGVAESSLATIATKIATNTSGRTS